MLRAEWIELQGEGGANAPPDPFAADLPILVRSDSAPDKILNRSCAFCHQHIWNRALECPIVEDGLAYRICFHCYSKGRTCVHDITMKFVQVHAMQDLLATYSRAARTVNRLLADATAQSSMSEHLEPVPTELVMIDMTANMTSATTSHRLWARRQSPVALYCHQCKISRQVQQEILCHLCLQLSIKRKGHYCVACLWNRYGENMYDLLPRRDWACPQCCRVCNCRTCLRERAVKDFQLCVDPLASLQGRFFLSIWADDYRNKGSYVDGKVLAAMREVGMKGVVTNCRGESAERVHKRARTSSGTVSTRPWRDAK
ncbi:hypothetical protein BC831DRAFT_294735 [Entophlyctis helioformis]|nr:hypothetical protein BC831DRAFT_294735 [Entophlyctis helioformis]